MERRNLIYAPPINAAAALFKEAPTKLLKRVATWMIIQMANGREIVFPGLGAFRMSKTKVRVPGYSPTDRCVMETKDVVTIRFRPSATAKREVVRFSSIKEAANASTD